MKSLRMRFHWKEEEYGEVNGKINVFLYSNWCNSLNSSAGNVTTDDDLLPPHKRIFVYIGGINKEVNN